MARQGTPTAGLQEIAKRVFVDGAQYSLVAYTNAQDSLDGSITLSSLVQPSQVNGYAPILLNGTWDPTNGVAIYTHAAGSSNDGFGNPCWFATGTWSAAVTGAAIVIGSIVQHFMDLRDANGNPTTFVAAAGKKLSVNINNLTSP